MKTIEVVMDPWLHHIGIGQFDFRWRTSTLRRCYRMTRDGYSNNQWHMGSTENVKEAKLYIKSMGVCCLHVFVIIRA